MDLLDHPLISERYFFPRPDPVKEPMLVRTAAGKLSCWRSPPRGGERGRALVHFHGNGEVVADYVPWMSEAFADLGVEPFFAEYRGYGGSDGTPALGAMLDDVEAIANALNRDPSEVVVYGRSVGSLCAIEWVHRFPTTAALVLESGIADVLERLLLRVRPTELGASEQELAAAVGARLDHRAKLSAYRGETLVLHAEHDTLVLPSHAERNASAAATAGRSRLVLFPEGDHNSVLSFNREAILEEVRALLDRLDGRIPSAR